MNDSIANTFSAAASERKLAVRSRVGSMCSVTLAGKPAYGGTALRPDVTPSTWGSRPAAVWTLVCSS